MEGRYHHGDLRRALLEEAVRTIRVDGLDQLTLRAVGERLGVSRTALYRHFSSKQALVGAVGREGFRMLRQGLGEAWERERRGRAGFEAMARAYLQFAAAHPQHYRVMFSVALPPNVTGTAVDDEGVAAFQVVVDAIVELQDSGLVRADNPRLLARYVWSTVHGVAMLVIDGQLRGDDEPETLATYTLQRLREAIRGPRAGA